MTNDDLKRFYGVNELPQENKDFVRYDKDGRIKSKSPIKSDDIVTLDYFNNINILNVELEHLVINYYTI